jgi:hypothetical protein
MPARLRSEPCRYERPSPRPYEWRDAPMMAAAQQWPPKRDDGTTRFGQELARGPFAPRFGSLRFGQRGLAGTTTSPRRIEAETEWGAAMGPGAVSEGSQLGAWGDE